MGIWAEPGLVSAALAGEEPAAERLIEAIWPRCYRLAATVLADRSLAQDAAQEACAIVHRKVRSLRTAAAFDAWLYRIVMREASRVRRRHAAPPDPYFEGTLRGDDTVAVDVWAALATLAPELRDAVVLFYFDDLRGEDVAAILGVPHATVRTRLAKAREKLRGLLDDYRSETPAAGWEMKQHAL